MESCQLHALAVCESWVAYTKDAVVGGEKMILVAKNRNSAHLLLRNDPFENAAAWRN